MAGRTTPQQLLQATAMELARWKSTDPADELANAQALIDAVAAGDTLDTIQSHPMTLWVANTFNVPWNVGAAAVAAAGVGGGGGGGGGGELPPFSSDLLCWLDPTDETTMFQDSAGTVPVTTAGDPIGRWEDKSGAGNHWTQTDNARRPTWQEDHVRFQNDWLVGPDLSAFVDTGTVVVDVQAVDLDSPGGANNGCALQVSGFQGSNGATHWALSAALNYTSFCSSARPQAFNWNTLSQAPTDRITYANTKPSTTELNTYVDGVFVSTSTVSGGNMGTAPVIGGAKRNADISPWAMNDLRFYGMLLYDRDLSASEVSDVHDYLADTGGNSLLTDLVHWWEMDEASATRVDSQGSLDLAVQGGAGGIPGRNVIGGDGADFETTYDAKRLESADAAATVGGLSKLTFAGWVVMDTKPSDFRAFWMYGNYATGFGGSGFGLLCRYDSASDRFRFTASGGGPVVNVNWSAAPVIGQAYLIACTVDLDNDEIGISVDGAAPVTAAFTPSSYNSGGTGWRVIVGNYQQAFPRPPDAGIARVGFWSRVLSAGDIADLYNSGAGLNFADLG